jgi:hypothetical protein
MSNYPLYFKLAKNFDRKEKINLTKLSATINSITLHSEDSAEHELEINMLIYFHFYHIEGNSPDEIPYQSRYRSPKLKKTQIYKMELFPLELLSILNKYVEMYT